MLKNVNGLRKSDRTRQHLMATALNAFEERGYDACTMRDLAKEAGVTAPAFYYYFRSKEEIVAAFYQSSLEEHLLRGSQLLRKGGSVSENLRRLLLQRFDEFSKQRRTLAVLRRFSLNREHQISPFHDSHREIRRQSVDLFELLIEQSNLNWPSKTRRELAQILWQFHLGLLLYWIGDESKGQKKTHELVERSLSHLTTVLMLLRLPGAHFTLGPIFETLKRAGLLEDL